MAKGQQRDLKREAYWRSVMARFGKSGLSARGFCAGERLSEASFYFWRRVIRERDAQESRTRPAFVPVVVRDGGTGHGDAGLVIELRGGRTLRLPAALPALQVAELVHAIEAGAAPAGSVATEARA
jgi:hypothetical protein